MASDQCLSADEWYKFLVNEVKLPVNAKSTIENLARALEANFMIEEDFIQLSEDDLRNMFDVHQIGLLNRFTRWKNSRAGQTSKSSSSLGGVYDARPVQQVNPLISLVDLFKTPVNQNQIHTAQSLLGSDTKNVSEIVPNYLSAIDSFLTFGDRMVPETNRAYYRCKACDREVWVAKDMSALADFPGCFRCQRHWLAGLLRSTR